MRVARVFGARQRGVRALRWQRFAQQLAAHSRHRLHDLDSRALGSGRRKDRFRVLEPGVLSQGHVTKAEDRKQANAGFDAATT